MKNIIDVLSDSSFAVEHIKGAKNFCVYEMAFVEKVTDAYPDMKTELSLYGFNDKTEEAVRAKFLLEDAGYTNVNIIKGGLEGWKKKGNPTVKGDGPKLLDGDYVVKKSRIHWTGRNIGNKHTGTVDLDCGNLRFDSGMPKLAKLVLDMKSISNDDLDAEYAPMLESHLKSDDFFSVEKFPTALLELIDVKGENGIFNLKANLTIKNITNVISFPASIHLKDGVAVMNAHFDIDRSKWNVKYGSEKFFSRLGIHLIDDKISFDVILEATPHPSHKTP